MSFRKDLNYGENIEALWTKHLESKKTYKQIFKVEGNFKYFDLIAVTKTGEIETYEIKSDRKWMDTGNTVIEIGSKNNDSGVLASKADYLIQYLDGDGFYSITIDKLRKFYIMDEECRRTSGGDMWHSKLMIVPLDLFKKVFNKIKK